MKLFDKMDRFVELFTIYSDLLKNCSGLTSVECKAVSLLKREGKPMTMKEIAAKLDFSTSRATRVVDALVNKGFAEREACDGDRRICYIKLSDCKCVEERLPEKLSLLKEYSKEELEEIENMMEKLNVKLKTLIEEQDVKVSKLNRYRR